MPFRTNDALPQCLQARSAMTHLPRPRTKPERCRAISSKIKCLPVRSSPPVSPATPEGRPPAGRGPRRSDRHPVRAEERHPLGDAPGKDGLRLRHDLLAAAQGLAGGRHLAGVPPRAARPARQGRADRLEPVLAGRGEPAGQGGRGHHGTEPDRPRQARQQASPRRGPARHPLGRPAHGRQRPRQRRPRGGAGRRAAGPPAARPAATAAEQAARRTRPTTIPRCRRACRKRGIVPRIARRGIESSERLGRHRWVVERTLSWIARCRRLIVRYERRDDVHLAFLVLACAAICFRFLPEVLLGGLSGAALEMRRLGRAARAAWPPISGRSEEAGRHGQHAQHHAQEQSRSHRGPSLVAGRGSPRSFAPDRRPVCAERHSPARIVELPVDASAHHRRRPRPAALRDTWHVQGRA